MSPAEPVRVLIVAPAPAGGDRIGGIVNFIRGFVRVAPDDFEIDVAGVAVGDEAPRNDWQPLTLAGRQVRFLPTARMATSRRQGRVPLKARIVSGIVRSRRRIPTKGRVVQLHAPAMDLAFVGRRAPIIRVVHNAPGDLATSGASAWSHMGRLVRVVEDYSFRRADSVFFVSRSAYGEYAADPRFAGHVSFLPNFFDESLFVPLDRSERQEARRVVAAELDLPHDAPWLLFAGRLDHQKDPSLAIRTLAEVRAAPFGASAVLLLAGEGNLLQDAQGAARKHGVGEAVRFLGNWPQARLVRLMQTADLLLLTSRFESGPTVAYEALASGLPVVSTPVGEIRHIVSSASTGWISDGFAASELAQGVGWALAQERDAVAGRCWDSAQPYSARVVLQPFIAEHRRLAAAGSDRNGFRASG